VRTATNDNRTKFTSLEKRCNFTFQSWFFNPCVPGRGQCQIKSTEVVAVWIYLALTTAT